MMKMRHGQLQQSRNEAGSSYSTFIKTQTLHFLILL